MMEINDLNTLTRDDNQNGLYNLMVLNFDYSKIDPTLIKPYIVLPEDEMRMDSVCKNIYNNLNYIDFLMKLNYMDNPLNVMAGDTINYVDPEVIDMFKVNTSDNTATRNILLNANKSSKKDTNRQQYVESNYSLPPTYLSEPGESVSIEGSQIVIGNAK